MNCLFLLRISQAALLLGCLHTCTAEATRPITVPLTSDHWRVANNSSIQSRPDVQFVRHEGFPQGVLVVKSGAAALNGLRFRNGTIEFDMKGMAEDIPGIQFRQEGPEGRQDAEEFYVRTFPDCRASNDCIQYAPVIHGFMLWNAYPQYQTQASILDGWNHIKLVVSGQRMNVYINRSAIPALLVGRLESGAVEGEVQLRGPAFFANLVITPDAVEGLAPQPLPDSAANDHGVIRHWELAPQTPLHYGRVPAYGEMPGGSDVWKSVAADPSGLVNLNRSFWRTDGPPLLTWVRYSVDAKAAVEKRVSLGWLGQVWVFVNGKLVTEGKNFYDPESERREPDGRLSLENGSFSIPLRPGNNEIAIALFAGVHDNDHTPNRYGWGVEMRFDDPRGMHLPQ